MRITIDGRTIKTEKDLHIVLATELEFGAYYGHNLAALWDRLSCDVERPIHLIWLDSAVSKQAIGEEVFHKIIKLFEDVRDEDAAYPTQDKFTFELL